MDDCLFCKISKGEIPSFKVYEDTDFIAFLDIAPASKGHILIVPKHHSKNIEDLPDEIAAKVLPLVKKLVKAMKVVYGFTDFNLMQNNGEIAGQSVHHFHLHIIPRYEKGHFTDLTPKPNDPSVTEENAKKVRELLK